MAAIPVQMPSAVRDETFGGVTYHVEGELVPVLHLELSAMPVYFENHILLWKEPKVDVALKPLKGAFKRIIAGIPVFLTMADGPGNLGLSRDGVGHVFALHLKPGQAIDVREHQFLAATDSVEYGFKRVKGVSNVLFGGTGFFIDTFRCDSGAEGVVWLHGYGNVFEVALAPGDQIDIEPGGWIYKEHSVQMETKFQKLSTGLFASAGQLFWNRFTGPGRIAVQSMSYHMETSD